MKLKVFCKKCEAEKKIDYTVQNFKKYMRNMENYICLDCFIEHESN